MKSSLALPMSGPDIGPAEIAAVNRVLRSGYLSIGPLVGEFEASFCRYLGTRHAVGVSSGTAGLHLAVIAAGVRDGDYVLTSPFSFVASANAVLYERATPIFVDVDERTGNMSPLLLEEALENIHREGRGSRFVPRSSRMDGNLHPRIGAVLPVHAFGHPADMDPILQSAKARAIPVIEDACEAIGAEYKQRRVGSLGDSAVFAFYPNKQITTGEGGMIVTNDDAWDRVLRSLRNQGRDLFDEWLRHDRLGYNYRLDEMSAAVGSAQMTRVDELLRNRERVAGWYKKRLGQCAGVKSPFLDSTTVRMSWFLYVVRLAPGIDRRRVMTGLKERGIPSRPYFSPIHLQPFYVERFGYRRGDFPVTEALGENSLALPFSGVMTEEQVDFVCQALLSVVEVLQSRK